MVGDALTDWEGARKVGTGFVGIQAGQNKTFPANEILLANLTALEKYLNGN